MSRVLLVGEQLAHGGNPRFALYPSPPNSAGARLARILGLLPNEYLERFERVNLCADAWDTVEAEISAYRVKSSRPLGSGVVLLGRKAQLAFGWKRPRYEVSLSSCGLYVLALPHPSGLCREWNDPRNVVTARIKVTELEQLPKEAA